MNEKPRSDVSGFPPRALAHRGSAPAARVRTFVRSHVYEVGFAAAIAAVCAGVLLWQTREYMPFFVDDSFIALRYVERLLHGDGLTWTDGERVEGYSDLLWVLLVAAGGLLRRDLIEVSRVLGVSATVITVLAIVHASRPRRIGDALPALVGSLAMVLTSPVIAWSIGGLEQPLLAALVTWATVLGFRLVEGATDRRTVFGVGVLLGLAAVTRPDGALFTLTTCAGILLATGLTWSALKEVFRIAATAGSFFLGQLLFRRVYYQAWVPNTAHVKLAFTSERVAQGWQYVAGAAPYLRPLVLMALAATALSMTRADSRKRIAIPVASVVAWTAYVVVIGGDISPARRHLVVTIVLLSLVVSEGLRALDTRAVWLMVAAGALAAVGLFTLARDQREDPEKAHAIHDTWVWSGRDVGRFLSRAFAAERPLVAVDAAGTLPYYAPELPCLDMLGLNDRAIATLHPPDFGKGYLGHELGNGAYILSRRPDLIVFHNSLGDEVATWRGGRELEDSDEFARLYQLVTFETPEGARTRLWVRKEDGRIGVKRTDLEVAIPGYLFHTSRGGVARLDPQGRVGLQVDGSHPASMLVAGLAPGRWRARVDESGALDVTVVGQGEQTKGSAGTDLFFAQRSEAPVTLLVTLREGERAHLRGVFLQRVQD